MIPFSCQKTRRHAQYTLELKLSELLWHQTIIETESVHNHTLSTRTQASSTKCKCLNTLVVTDENGAIRSNTTATRLPKFAFAEAKVAKSSQKAATVRLEDCYSVVESVADEEVVNAVKRDCKRVVEFSRLRTRTAKSTQKKAALSIENL